MGVFYANYRRRSVVVHHSVLPVDDICRFLVNLIWSEYPLVQTIRSYLYPIGMISISEFKSVKKSICTHPHISSHIRSVSVPKYKEINRSEFWRNKALASNAVLHRFLWIQKIESLHEEFRPDNKVRKFYEMITSSIEYPKAHAHRRITNYKFSVMHTRHQFRSVTYRPKVQC